MKPAARACVVALALLMGACAGTPAPEAQTALPDTPPPAITAEPAMPAAPALQTAPARIDGVAGEVVAVHVKSRAAASDRLRVRLDDGTDVPTRTYEILVAQGVKPDPWLGPTGEWSAAAASGREDASILAVFTLPRQAKGQGIWIGDERHDVQWLAPPEAIAGADSAIAWEPTLPPAAAGNTALMAWLREAARSPLSRWRVRLLLDGMRSAVPPIRFTDPIVESWATYNEQRWRIALARLWLADEDVCRRLRKRLSGVVDFGGSVYAPAWPTDQRALDRLLNDLLAPTGTIAARAQQYMSEQPQGVVWVVDDGGVLGGPDRLPLPLIGIANFTGRDVLAFGYMGPEPTRPDLLPAKAYSAQVLTVAGGWTEPRATVRLSRWSATVPVAVAPIPVMPPGLRIGPLAPDLSMERWLYAQPEAPAFSAATVALLHRPAPGADGERRWELYVECRVPDGMPAGAEDRVCVCIGPPGLPGGVICVERDGLMSLRLMGRDDVGPPRVVHVASGPDRWSFRVTVPGAAIEQGGRLRLGMMRRGMFGRQAWPRPLLPWQDFPSRALIDLSTWTGFATHDQ